MKAKLLILLTFIVFAAACSNAPKEKRIKIGFAMDTLKEERWQRDHDAFEAHCKALNVECVITVADNKADKQANDVDNLLTQGVDALVIAPHDATYRSCAAALRVSNWKIINTIATAAPCHSECSSVHPSRWVYEDSSID